MYRLKIEKTVIKHLEKISEPDYSRIRNALNGLIKNPRPPGYKKLKNRTGYRIRQGDYRIIYEINDGLLIIYVIELGHRKDIYD